MRNEQGYGWFISRSVRAQRSPDLHACVMCNVLPTNSTPPYPPPRGCCSLDFAVLGYSKLTRLIHHWHSSNTKVILQVKSALNSTKMAVAVHKLEYTSPGQFDLCLSSPVDPPLPDPLC
ncbi:hypothetical protein INR49_008440 [Caranx melampygus]|nr:hypothetical protein INR49_008440 [Caranx melampygus]